MDQTQKQSGFTIVELLIVIVVIGILAAITIVAYNGIQTRAHAATAQADAENLAKLLTNANTINGSFPGDLTTINNGQPLSISDGTTYAYHPSNGNANYCVTVTNATTSYKISDANMTPQSGGCPGDGVGGVAAITNLANNPSFESGLTTVSSYQCNNSNVTTDAYTGTRVLRSTRNVTTGQTGPWWDATTVTPGTTYTVKLAARSNVPSNRKLNVEWKASDGTGVGTTSTFATLTTSSAWQTTTGTITAPAGAAFMRLTFYTSDTGTATDYVEVDGVMITQGNGNTYNYADGNTVNWIWTGATNTSASQGPPQ